MLHTSSLMFAALFFLHLVTCASVVTPSIVLDNSEPDGISIASPSPISPVASITLPSPIPAVPSSFPSDNRTIRALFNHTLSDKKVPGPITAPCEPLTDEILRSLPGIRAAAEHLGVHPDTVYIPPWSQSPSLGCLSPGTIDIVGDDSGPCLSETILTSETIVRAPALLTLPFQSALSLSGEMVVTEASSIMFNHAVSVPFSFGLWRLIELTITNQPGWRRPPISVPVTVPHLSSDSLKLPAPCNSYCYLKASFEMAYQATQCFGPVKSRVAFRASGGMCGYRLSDGSSGEDCCSNAMCIADMADVMDEAERTSEMVIEGMLRSYTTSEYEGDDNYEGTYEPVGI
ncbi:hypothetical protein DFH06DRAFT_1145253 [Mycena polygramma]|nr:hypothetical protein DFH06DRAFT_1145253 [Mycena polygramma]